MKVVILAAGRSKRMQPVPDKNFLNFCGKPLLWHQLSILTKESFEDFVLIGGKHNLADLKKLAGKFRKATNLAMKFKVVEQEDLEAGMAGAVLSLKKVVKDEPMLLVSSNDVVEAEAYQSILKASTDEKFDGFLIGKKVKEYFPGGYLKVGARGRIERIVEKPRLGKEPSDMINLVVHFHRNPLRLIEYLEKVSSKRDDRYEVALDKMMKDGVKFKVVPYRGYWQAIKYPWHILPLAKYFLEQKGSCISRKAQISDKAVIKGSVIIEEGVRVFEGAVINGPVYLGENVIVANNALVREAFLDEGCVVGYATEVARSYLGKNVWMHTNYIGDSVIMDDCSFGSGAVTGNLRLDEKNINMTVNGNKVDTGLDKWGCVMGPRTRVGINTSLMPGIKIGAGSFIGAAILVGKDIPENSYVRGQWKLKISPNKASVDEAARDKMRKKL